MGDKGKLIPPGQTEIRYGGLAGELVLPLRQWMAIMVIRLVLVGCAAGLVVLWGPWSLYAVVPVGGLWLIAWIWQHVTEDNAAARYGVPVVVVGLLMAWMWWAPAVVEVLWPGSIRVIAWNVSLRFTWGLHVAWRVLLSLPAGVYFWCYPHIIYRLRYEIADPWWPGPIKERLPESGPAFPGVSLRSEEVPAAQPETKLERVQVEVTHTSANGVRGMDRIDLLSGPSARRRMQEVAKMVVAGRPISEGELAGPGKPLAAGTEFRGFQDNLLERGLVVWKRPGAPTQGVILTAVGRQVFKRLAMGNGVGESAPPHQEDA